MTPDGPMLVQLRQHFFLRPDGLPFCTPPSHRASPAPSRTQTCSASRHWKVVLVLRPKALGRALLREGEVRKELERLFGKERVATVESLGVLEGELPGGRSKPSQGNCRNCKGTAKQKGKKKTKNKKKKKKGAGNHFSNFFFFISILAIAAQRLLRQARLLVAVHGAALTSTTLWACITF